MGCASPPRSSGAASSTGPPMACCSRCSRFSRSSPPSPAGRCGSALAGIGALALAVSLLFTAVYHLGYPDFRGEKLRKPLIGDVVWSAPTLATLSPIGAPLAHIGLHVSAVVHAYDTNTFLPPHSGGGN